MATPFKTPDNEQSFSGLIDAAILSTGKPASLTNIVSYANGVLRECQTLGLFARDLIEDELIVPSDQDGPYIWQRPALFRTIRAVKYMSCNKYPKLALPGRIQKDLTHYFYASDNYFVFAGAYANEKIATATYYYFKRLAYYGALGINTSNFPGGPYDVRPAYYDTDEEKWQYLNSDGNGYVDTTGDPDTDLAMQKLVSNWLLQDWYDLILSGTKNKIWSSSGDPRASAEYSNYKQLQKTMMQETAYESTGMQ